MAMARGSAMSNRRRHHSSAKSVQKLISGIGIRTISAFRRTALRQLSDGPQLRTPECGAHAIGRLLTMAGMTWL
jgi:hypothetical protein